MIIKILLMNFACSSLFCSAMDFFDLHKMHHFTTKECAYERVATTSPTPPKSPLETAQQAVNSMVESIEKTKEAIIEFRRHLQHADEITPCLGNVMRPFGRLEKEEQYKKELSKNQKQTSTRKRSNSWFERILIKAGIKKMKVIEEEYSRGVIEMVALGNRVADYLQ